MAKVVKQFRYYNETSALNQPSNATLKGFTSGSVFDDAGCFPILQLGIQTLPGTKFYLNDALDPILIGSTGIYELDLDGLAEILRISFASDSMETIKTNDTAHLIVDIIWDDGTVEQEG